MSGVSWNPSGTLVALSDKNGSAYVWDIATGRMHGRPLTVPGAGKAYSAAFSPDGRTLAVGYSNGVSYLWNVASGRRIATLSDPGGREIDSVAFNPTGSELVTADGNGHAYVWDITTGHQNDAPATALPDPAGAGVWSAVFSAGGMLATGDYNGNIYLWNVSTGQSTGPLVIPGSSPVSALAFSPDGSVIAAGNESGSMYLFGVAGQNGSFIYSASSIWALSFAGNTTLAMADRDGDTYLWRVNATALSASRIGTLRDPNSGSAGVGSLAFSHNGQWLVTGDTNGSAYSWKVG